MDFLFKYITNIYKYDVIYYMCRCFATSLVVKYRSEPPNTWGSATPPPFFPGRFPVKSGAFWISPQLGLLPTSRHGKLQRIKAHHGAPWKA